MHPFADLSAYLDGALDRSRREEVAAHLAGCALCRTRLGELRGAARLIAALPSAVPSRSLVPRVSVPVWLAPLRTLVSLGSGVAALLFVASALIASAPTATESATAAGGAAFGQSPAEDRKAVAPVAAPSSTTNPAAPACGVASTSPSGARNDSTAQSSSSAVPLAPVAQASPQPEPVGSEVAQRPLGPAPWVWLGLALALAALALILQRRLRAA